MSKQSKEQRRVASIKTAIEYGKGRLDGRFSKKILYRLLKTKQVVAYAHGGRRLVDLDSIDRYVGRMPIQPYPQPEEHPDE